MFCGIDIGSRAVKIALYSDGGIIGSRLLETNIFYREYGSRSPEGLAVDFERLDIGPVEGLTATGYGRNTLAIAGAQIISELKAHTRGALWQTGLQDFTLLDLGGQDSKVIQVRRGKMVDFQTNDKCAASTGRYLENMATVLGISLDELSRHSDQPAELSATCAIFGESELIGRLVEGCSVEELAAGVNMSIYRRIKPMLSALRSDTVVFTGGVALGGAVARFIESELGSEVIVPAEPQLNGAIGCAVFAAER